MTNLIRCSELISRNSTDRVADPVFKECATDDAHDEVIKVAEVHEPVNIIQVDTGFASPIT